MVMAKAHALRIIFTIFLAIGIFNLQLYFIDKNPPAKGNVVSVNDAPKKELKREWKNRHYSIDVSNPGRWIYFSFSKGSTVEQTEKWDIAFKRTKIITNSGVTNPEGGVAVLNVGGVDFEAVKDIPANGFKIDKKSFWGSEISNPALKGWYRYNSTTHKIKSNNDLYIVKTSENKFAKMKIVDYYCEDKSACITMEYVYPL